MSRTSTAGSSAAQITRFDQPNQFNDFRLQEYGVSVEKPLAVSPYFDLFVRGGYKESTARA